MQGKKQVVLDWSRLLGFDQASQENVARPQISDPRLGKLGSKVGSKPCSVRRDGVNDSRTSRLGSKIGVKPGFKTAPIGAKVGLKPTLRIGAKVGFKTSKA